MTDSKLVQRFKSGRSVGIILVGVLLVVLAIASVSVAAIRNTQLAQLTICTNHAILAGVDSFKSRDLAALDLNESNKQAVYARRHLFDLLNRHLHNETVNMQEVDTAYAVYEAAATRYEFAIDAYTAAIHRAPLLQDTRCSY